MLPQAANDNIAPGILGALTPLHLYKVAIHGGAFGRCFAAEWEAAETRISTSEPEAINWKRVDCLFQVGAESLSQGEEFKSLWVLFTSRGRKEQKIGRWIGAVSTNL